MISNLKSSLRYAATAVLLGLAVPAIAQTTDGAAQQQAQQPAAEIGESHLAAARRAIDAINATDDFDNILPNAATQVKSMLIPNNPDLEEEISTMVDERALGLAPRRAALEAEVARVYAQLFTEQELNDIAAFYESEAGQKLLSRGPAATREMMAAVEVWSNGIVRDLRESAFQGMNEMNARAVEASDGAAAETTPAETAPAEDAN